MKIYFDTNVIRYFATAFSSQKMEDDCRSHIVLSPVSALEAISQLATATRQQAYSAIQAMWNWLPEKTGILDHPAVLLRGAISTAQDTQDSKFFQEISTALTQCLNAETPDVVVAAASELRNLLETSKHAKAIERRDAVIQMRMALRHARRKMLSDEELAAAFRASIASRARAAPDNPKLIELAKQLNAYFEYDTARLKSALTICTYNFLSKKRKNDLFDAEQLVYLADPQMHFITTDTGYKHLLGGPQGNQIHLVTRDVLCHRNSAIEVLRAVISAN